MDSSRKLIIWLYCIAENMAAEDTIRLLSYCVPELDVYIQITTDHNN